MRKPTGQSGTAQPRPASPSKPSTTTTASACPLRPSQKDLERVEQIFALKFLGLPLRQIGTLLKRGDADLGEVLRLQRKAREAKQSMLAMAIRALRTARASPPPGVPADAMPLRKITDALITHPRLHPMA